MCREIENVRLAIEAIDTEEVGETDVEYIQAAVENAFGAKYSVRYEYHNEEPMFVQFLSGPYTLIVGYSPEDGDLAACFYGEYFCPDIAGDAIGDSAFTMEELLVRLEALFQEDQDFQNRMHHAFPDYAMADD